MKSEQGYRLWTFLQDGEIVQKKALSDDREAEDWAHFIHATDWRPHRQEDDVIPKPTLDFKRMFAIETPSPAPTSQSGPP